MKLDRFGLYETVSNRLVQINAIPYPRLTARFIGYYVDPNTGNPLDNDEDIRYTSDGESTAGPTENLVAYLGPYHHKMCEIGSLLVDDRINEAEEELNLLKAQRNELQRIKLGL